MNRKIRIIIKYNGKDYSIIIKIFILLNYVTIFENIAEVTFILSYNNNKNNKN